MFIKIPRSKKDLKSRKLVCGVGVNDAIYKVSPVIGGKQFKCPAYQKWEHMLERAYSGKYHSKHPTYKYVSVCKDWLIFSKFLKWFDTNNVEGYELDKDIKIKGNQTYSPESCIFIPKDLNLLLNDSMASRGDFPIGVNFKKPNNKYQASIRICGKSKYLGLFETPDLAHLAYKIAKNSEINRKAKQYPEFAKYLIQHLYDLAGGKSL